MVEQMIYIARAFARKWPADDLKPLPQTLIMLVVAGDVPSLTDEALHNCRIADAGDGILTLHVDDSEVQTYMHNWDHQDVIERGMSGPLR